MTNSIKKGKRYEREVAKLLTKLTGVRWFRVPISGAFATARKVKDSRFRGDLFTDDERFKDLVIECKILKRKPTERTLAKWITQAKRESRNKKWILIYRWNRAKSRILASDKQIIRKILPQANPERITIGEEHYFINFLE